MSEADAAAIAEIKRLLQHAHWKARSLVADSQALGRSHPLEEAIHAARLCAEQLATQAS